MRVCTACVVLSGGPGSGKGTQCSKLVESFGFAHFSAGDLLRAEVKSGSAQGDMINKMIQNGEIVPGQVTINLLKQAMASRPGPYLIDGFPRSFENAELFEKDIGR